MKPRARVAALAAVAALAGACEPVATDPCAWDSSGAPWLTFASARGGDYDIRVARADGSCVGDVTSDPSTDLSPTWSGRRIAFASDRGGAASIWIHDLLSGSESRLDTGGLGAALPAFSPDGALVAFEGRAPEAPTVDVHVVSMAGGTPIPVTSDAADDTAPAWSPDGAAIYFVSTRTGAYEVFSVAASGGDAVQVTTGSRIIGRPAVAPEGGALYFARRIAGSSATEVVRFELGTGTATVVSEADESEPAVSPDGARLLLRSFRYDASNPDVIAIDAGGGGHPARVTADPASDGSPAFAPGPVR